MQLSPAARKIIVCLMLASVPGLSFGDFVEHCASDAGAAAAVMPDMHAHHGGGEAVNEVPALDDCCEACVSVCPSGSGGSAMSLSTRSDIATNSAISATSDVDAGQSSAPPEPLLRPPINSL